MQEVSMSQPVVPFVDGPYVQAACFCEMMLQDNTGVLSLIRVIDQIIHTAAGPATPEEMPSVPYNLKVVLMLKSGAARGRSTLRIVPELPNGMNREEQLFSVHFNGEDQGVNMGLNMAFVFEMEGLYWFHVYIDNRKITSMPMRIRYNRVQGGVIQVPG
jgi:hypothetical protein